MPASPPPGRAAGRPATGRASSRFGSDGVPELSIGLDPVHRERGTVGGRCTSCGGSDTMVARPTG